MRVSEASPGVVASKKRQRSRWLGADVSALTGAVYAHPALPEVVQRAFGTLHEPDAPASG